MNIGDNMVSLDNIKESLDNNVNLTDDIRDNLYSLIYIFVKNYPDIDLTNLNNNLKTLSIEKSNKFINKRVSKYNPFTNILEFNIEKINEGYDIKHVMMHELLNIITNNGKQTGFNFENKFEALNEGYAEILTNNLVGNESDIPYLENEVISTNMISIMVGNDVMFNAYFNNDADLLVKSLVNEGVEVRWIYR